MGVVLATSALRHPSQPHALALTFAPRKVRWVIAPCIARKPPPPCKIWIELKSCFHSRSRRIYLAKPRENSREIEMRGGIISVCLNTPPQPRYCFGIGVKHHLGEADRSWSPAT